MWAWIQVMLDKEVLQYIQSLEKRIDEIETRELSRVSSWNVGTGSAATAGNLIVDVDITAGEDIIFNDGLRGGYGRFEGGVVPAGMSGGGVELGWVSSESRILSYDRTASTQQPLHTDASDFEVRNGATVYAKFADGDLSIRNGLYVGNASSDPDPDEIVADGDIRAGGDLSATGDIRTIAWADYSATSTIVGWSSYTIKKIFYKKVGKLVFVEFYIDGTSNVNTATFTVPYTVISSLNNLPFYIRARNNGVWQAAGMGWLAGGSATVTLYTTQSGNNWTASGTKTIAGQFWYQTT
jgi:hypothetical protein